MIQLLLILVKNQSFFALGCVSIFYCAQESNVSSILLAFELVLRYTVYYLTDTFFVLIKNFCFPNGFYKYTRLSVIGFLIVILRIALEM